jgi:hypothetical protein
MSNFWLRSITLAERKAAQARAPVRLYALEWETPALAAGSKPSMRSMGRSCSRP